MVEARGLLRSQLEEALAELVALGLVTSDSFAGLRALLVPSDRAPAARPAPPARAMFGMEDAGRWALARRAAAAAQTRPRGVEHVARTLLRRYGVVFWRLLEREAAWLPPWRDLLRVYRRLESARRDPRRPFRRRLFRRAVRLARSDRHVARCPARVPRAKNGCRSPAPTRSISPAS